MKTRSPNLILAVVAFGVFVAADDLTVVSTMLRQIIFDLEIAFFIPWALVLDKLGTYGLLAMVVFVIELVIGFFFVWKKGALEWE